MRVQGEHIVHYPTQVTGQPLVSVIVIAYNQEQYIAQCLDSILEQEVNFPYEIIIGEDNSTDGTRAICESYADQHPNKIRLIEHSRENVIKIDGKPTGIFNMLYNYQETNGKYVALCEGDDYWCSKEKLQKQVDFLEANNDFAICFHPVKLLNEAGELHADHQTHPPKGVSDVHDLVHGNYMRTPSVMYRKTLDSYPEYIQYCTPGDFIIYLLNALEGHIMNLEEELAVYRVQVGSWSSLPDHERNYHSLTVYKNLYDHLKDTSIGGDLVEIIQLKAMAAADEAYASGNKEEAKTFMRMALDVGRNPMSKMIFGKIKGMSNAEKRAKTASFKSLRQALLLKMSGKRK